MSIEYHIVILHTVSVVYDKTNIELLNVGVYPPLVG